MLLSETETGAKAGADAAANAAIPKRIQTDRFPSRRSKNHVGPSSRTGSKRAAAGGMCPQRLRGKGERVGQPVHHRKPYPSKQAKRVEREALLARESGCGRRETLSQADRLSFRAASRAAPSRLTSS